MNFGTRSNSKLQASKDKAGDKNSAASLDPPPPHTTPTGHEEECDGGMKSLIQRVLSEFISNDEFLDRLADRVADKVIDKLKQIVTSHVMDVIEPRFFEIEKKIESLTNEVAVIRKNYAAREESQESRMDGLAQYQRRNNVRIFGIPEVSGENITTVVTKMFSEKLDLKVDTSLIDRCHRVGRPSAPGESRSRAVLVKFISYQTRRAVISGRRRLKGTPITIREDLTKRRNDFFRQVAARVGFKNVWTIDGRILWIENGKIHSSNHDIVDSQNR